MVSAIRVNHLSTERGMEVRGAVLAMAAAALVVGKPPFEFTTSTQTNKLMHQHECNTNN